MYKCRRRSADISSSPLQVQLFTLAHTHQVNPAFEDTPPIPSMSPHFETVSSQSVPEFIGDMNISPDLQTPSAKPSSGKTFEMKEEMVLHHYHCIATLSELNMDLTKRADNFTKDLISPGRSQALQWERCTELARSYKRARRN